VSKYFQKAVAKRKKLTNSTVTSRVSSQINIATASSKPPKIVSDTAMEDQDKIAAVSSGQKALCKNQVSKPKLKKKGLKTTQN
jgi:hypothetical protein